MLNAKNPIPSVDWSLNDTVVVSKDHDEFKNILAYIDHPENTRYVHDVRTKDVIFDAVCTPMDGEPMAEKYGLPVGTAQECGQAGSTNLIAIRTDGATGEPLPDKLAENHCIDNAAWPSVLNAAKLYGAALGRMDPIKKAETLNNGMAVAIGYSIMLVRFDKLFAIHSDGYMPMPISTLFDMTEKTLSASVGELKFTSGMYLHNITTALWTLPEAAEAIRTAYENALKYTKAKVSYSRNLMPGVILQSSDTQSSAARILPVFITPYGGSVRLCDGVAVRHERRSGELEGVDLFQKELGEVFSLFLASAENAQALANLEIAHPSNCLVNLGKKYDIPKRFINAANVELIGEIGEGVACTAFDIAMALSNMTVLMGEDDNTSPSFIIDIQEKVAKVLRLRDWGDFDLSIVS